LRLALRLRLPPPRRLRPPRLGACSISDAVQAIASAVFLHWTCLKQLDSEF